MEIKRIGVVFDKCNPRAINIVEDIVKLSIEYGIELIIYPLIPDEILCKYSNIECVNDISLIKGDIVISIGGDGTILRTFLFLKDKDAPVMGIGLGEKNFLSTATYEDYLDAVNKLFSGKVYFKQEMRLDVELPKHNINLPPVLNDVVFATSIIGKTIDAYVALYEEGSKKIIWHGKSDGVIISTPIGSTAYSYSAGGPVIDTDLECILITPLLPVSKKPPLVLKPSRTIILWASRRKSKPVIVLDGQIKVELDWDDEVIVKKSKHYANFVVTSKEISVKRIVKSAR